MNKWIWLAAAAILFSFGVAQKAATIDGKVAAGEYAKTFKHEKSGITISWSIVGDTIYLALQGESTGWIGIGFLNEKDDKKMGADQYIFTMEAGKMAAFDMVQVKRTGAPKADDDEGGKNSILQSAGSYAGKAWTVEFSRKLKTGDSSDVDIAAGKKLNVLIAHGPEMSLKEEHKKSERWYLEDFAF